MLKLLRRDEPDGAAARSSAGASRSSAPARARSCWPSEVIESRAGSLGLMDIGVERNAYGRQIDSRVVHLQPETSTAATWRPSSSARRSSAASARMPRFCYVQRRSGAGGAGPAHGRDISSRTDHGRPRSPAVSGQELNEEEGAVRLHREHLPVADGGGHGAQVRLGRAGSLQRRADAGDVEHRRSHASVLHEKNVDLGDHLPRRFRDLDPEEFRPDREHVRVALAEELECLWRTGTWTIRWAGEEDDFRRTRETIEMLVMRLILRVRLGKLTLD